MRRGWYEEGQIGGGAGMRRGWYEEGLVCVSCWHVAPRSQPSVYLRVLSEGSVLSYRALWDIGGGDGGLRRIDMRRSEIGARHAHMPTYPYAQERHRSVC